MESPLSSAQPAVRGGRPQIAMQHYRLARDDNHNDRTQHSANILAKESGLAALEAFQREYLPAMARQSLPSLPSSPPPTPSPAITGNTDNFQHNATFDEQFKDLYEIDDNPNRRIFLDKLFNFMQRRGTPINRLPVMAKHVLDLYELFNKVVEKGGLVEVINKKQWQEIIRELRLPSSITSAAFTLRTQYTRYLYPYECKTKNLSQPSDLSATVESQRREGRRGYEESNPAMFSSSPFPFSLPQFPVLPGHLRPKMREESLLSPPMLPPGFSPVDVTRLTLMKMMGQSQLPFLPSPFPGADPDPEETAAFTRPPGKKESDRNSKDDQQEQTREEEERNKLLVCIEVNSVKYQGILFAQSDKNKDFVQ